MALDDKDKEAIAEMLKAHGEGLHKQFSEHVNGTVGPVIQRLDKMDKEHPGMFKRIAGETFTELSKGAGGSGGGDKDKKATNSEEIEALKKQNETLAKQFEEQQKQLAARDIESELRKHIRGDPKTPIKWFDEEEAIAALLPLIGKSAGGKLGITVKKQVGNADMDDFLPLPAAVQWLVNRKPHWIDSEVNGGSGATGGDAGGGKKVTTDKAESMTWEEMQNTPGLLNQLIDEGKLELINRKRRESIAKMRAAKQGRSGPQARLAGRTI